MQNEWLWFFVACAFTPLTFAIIHYFTFLVALSLILATYVGGRYFMGHLWPSETEKNTFFAGLFWACYGISTLTYFFWVLQCKQSI